MLAGVVVKELASPKRVAFQAVQGFFAKEVVRETGAENEKKKNENS